MAARASSFLARLEANLPRAAPDGIFAVTLLGVPIRRAGLFQVVETAVVVSDFLRRGT